MLNTVFFLFFKSNSNGTDNNIRSMVSKVLKKLINSLFVKLKDQKSMGTKKSELNNRARTI